MFNPKESLLRSVRRQSHRFPSAMREIDRAVADEEYRKAFLLMSELKQKGLWVTSEEDERNLEEFWWKYAN